MHAVSPDSADSANAGAANPTASNPVAANSIGGVRSRVWFAHLGISRLGAARLGEWSLLLFFALLYLATLDNGLQPYELHGGDLITHQYAQVQARPSNAPGYPLYTMGGWLWFHALRPLVNALSPTIPNPLPILSSYSMLWALLALWLFYRIVLRLQHTSPANTHDAGTPGYRLERRGAYAVALALLLSLFYGTTYFFWYYATTTEQYSSAIAQTLAIIYVYLRWQASPSELWRLYLLAFLSGLSLAHMLTVALIVPPLIIVVLWQSPGLLRSVRAILCAVIAAALPLASYAYVYLRGARHPEWWGEGDWASPTQWFWAFVSTSQGRAELMWAFEPGRPLLGNGFPELIGQELTIPFLVLGLFGLSRFPRRTTFLLYTTLLLYLIFCWFYRFGNWFQVILPAYPLILLGLLPWLVRLRATAQRLAHRPARLLQGGLLSLLLLAAVWRFSASFPEANSRNRPEDTGLDRAARLLDYPLPQQAGLFAAVEDALALNYLIEIWGVQPDLSVVSSTVAGQRQQAGETILATWDATPQLLDELPNRAVYPNSINAEWVQIANHPPAVVPPADGTRIDWRAFPVTITPDLQLVGLWAAPAPPGSPVYPPSEPAIDILLGWEMDSGQWPPETNISVRLLRDNTQIRHTETGEPIQQDRPRPVHGHYQAPKSPRPATVYDGYRLPLPAPYPADVDAVLVLLYRQTPKGFENITEVRIPIR